MVAESLRGTRGKSSAPNARLTGWIAHGSGAFVELNEPRWQRSPAGHFHEAWYLVASEPRAQQGLWIRYTSDCLKQREFAVWGSWFDGQGVFALKSLVPAATISRSVEELIAGGCSGEVEAGGHSLRWRLSFGQSGSGEDFIPGWLRLPAKLRGSGFALAKPATTVTGAVEVDGRMIEFQRVAAGQAHLWGRSRYPAWAWARCNAFAEDPDASIDLLEVVGPGGVRVPMFVLRLRGETHRFCELPWIALTTSKPAAPAWHFSAQNARLAIDGVVHVQPSQMVQVQYEDPDGSFHHCVNSEIASMEVRVRSRRFLGARLRPETTLTSKYGACLEFCGLNHDERVQDLLLCSARPEETK